MTKNFRLFGAGNFRGNPELLSEIAGGLRALIDDLHETGKTRFFKRLMTS
jgi:hypothetical protein